MTYSETLSQRLQALGATEGARLSVAVDDASYEGALMPHHPFSDPDVIVLRLESGYNVGVRVGQDSKLALVAPPSSHDGELAEPAFKKGRPEMTLLTTGGTIASRAVSGGGSVSPELSALDMLAMLPELEEMANIRPKAPFAMYSEEIGVPQWQEMAALVADELNSGVEGVILTHGTDSMGYSAAALSFMLGEIGRPVTLVGAQRSPDRPSSDAPSNLLAAARFNLNSDMAEVGVMMHAGPSDDLFALHRGTRVRKMHSSRRDAFRSLNINPLAHIDEKGKISVTADDYRRKGKVKVSPRTEMEEDVVLLHQYPGMSPALFEDIIMNSKGVVIAGSGMGHVNSSMRSLLGKAVKAGVQVVMSTQCLGGSTNLNVYPGGQELLGMGVIPVDDMLPETAWVKLMWVMANHDESEIGGIMRQPLQGECGDRRCIDV